MGAPRRFRLIFTLSAEKILLYLFEKAKPKAHFHTRVFFHSGSLCGAGGGPAACTAWSISIWISRRGCGCGRRAGCGVCRASRPGDYTVGERRD